MRGILEKVNDKWIIKYLLWAYDDNNEGTMSNFMKRPMEFAIELDPSDAKDVELLRNTQRSLENKEVIFSFKEKNGERYGTLKNPAQTYSLEEIEQELLNNYTKTKNVFPSANEIKKDFGHECFICKTTLQLSDSKQMCEDCLGALKSLILEKRNISK